VQANLLLRCTVVGHLYGGDIGAPALSCNSTEFMKYIALWFALAFFELE
jgi:hypothetical protein